MTSRYPRTFPAEEASSWRRIRRYAVPRWMIERATERRLTGDWHGACAAANVDVDFGLADSAQQITLAGGGGTDMRAGIERALALPERPGVVIVLTDGLTPWPGELSSCRLIAVLTSQDPPSPPVWAETVRITRATADERD
ncbi:MAG TPA: VWA-like domain-containing protein [Trebonia sp.]